VIKSLVVRRLTHIVCDLRPVVRIKWSITGRRVLSAITHRGNVISRMVARFAVFFLAVRLIVKRVLVLLPEKLL
jgi:hypothetical protein